MKTRFQILVLAIFIVSGAEAIANDAFVLPKGVYRFTSGTSTLTGTQEYDESGQRNNLGSALGPAVQSIGQALNAATGGTFPGPTWNGLSPSAAMEATVYREDLALEYGMTDRLSISVQAPLYFGSTVAANPNSDLRAAVSALNASGAPSAGPGKLGELFNRLLSNGTNAGTLGDLLIGAKYQFTTSASTPISKEPGTYRAAVALGAALPTGTLASPDTNDISTTTADSKSWIAGARTYWDYQFSPSFFANFYTEHEYRFAGASKFLAVDPATVSYQVLDVDYRPGFYNHLELDFNMVPRLSESFTSDSGIQVTGDFTAPGKYTSIGQSTPGSSSIRVVPYVGVFYSGTPLPMKFKTIYNASVTGRNSKALNGFTFVLQAFLKF